MGIWHDKLKESDKRLIIISGAQRGADQAGLAAARDNDLLTGGTAPKGWITLNGPNPVLAKLGLIESNSPKYPPRTYDNVKNSDGTIRLAYDFTTSGEVCTLKAITFYEKPYFDCDLNDLPGVALVINWLAKNNIKVLNIAGNAGKTKEEGSEIFKKVRHYLNCVFKIYNMT